MSETNIGNQRHKSKTDASNDKCSKDKTEAQTNLFSDGMARFFRFLQFTVHPLLASHCDIHWGVQTLLT